jgi:ketosteroid isomerase-like protein
VPGRVTQYPHYDGFNNDLRILFMRSRPSQVAKTDQITKPFCLLCGLLLIVFANIGVAGTVPDDDFFRDLVKNQYVEPFRKGDIDRWIQSFDEQALALHNRRPADRGRAAIAAFGKMVHDHFELREYEVVVTDVRRSGDWVYTSGIYTTQFVSKTDGSLPFGREQGKFLLLWELQGENGWKIIVDTGNSNQ